MNEDYTYEVDGEPEVYGIDNRVLPKFGLTAEFHGTIEKSIRNPAVFYAMTYKHRAWRTSTAKRSSKTIIRPATGSTCRTTTTGAARAGRRRSTIPAPWAIKVPVCDIDGNTPYAWLVYTAGKWDEANRGFEQEGQWFPHDRYARLRFRRAGLYRGQSLQRPVDRNEGQGFGQFGTLSRSLRSVYVHHR